jgi:hypothetical protein
MAAVIAARRFNFDHRGPEIAQNHGGEGASDDRGNINDSHAV